MELVLVVYDLLNMVVTSVYDWFDSTTKNTGAGV